MRSRYAAYVLGKVDHILESLHPNHRQDVDRKATEAWSTSAKWEGLDVVSTEGGGAGEDKGKVEFVARFRLNNVPQTHHERASFERFDDRWYYVDGQMVPNKPVVHDGPRAGRNDPCPCGSGKKYKKCHGAAN
jgi:SEC-C motif-containing protein